MKPEELEIKKFELEQKVKLEELELRKKELDLKIQEQKGERIATPLILSIIGGLITLITGITLNYFENKSRISLEDRKFQSSLLLKATDAETYDEFSNMLIALQENGLLSLDSAKLANFRKQRLIREETEKIEAATMPSMQNDGDTLLAALPPQEDFVWTVVAGGEANLEGARTEQARAQKAGFEEVGVWLHKNAYKTCIGKYADRTTALNHLFEIKENLHPAAKVVRLDAWCPTFTYDPEKMVYRCF